MPCNDWTPNCNIQGLSYTIFTFPFLFHLLANLLSIKTGLSLAMWKLPFFSWQVHFGQKLAYCCQAFWLIIGLERVMVFFFHHQCTIRRMHHFERRYFYFYSLKYFRKNSIDRIKSIEYYYYSVLNWFSRLPIIIKFCSFRMYSFLDEFHFQRHYNVYLDVIFLKPPRKKNYWTL